MKASWRIARLAGIDVRVHVTFFLLLVWIGWASWAAERSLVNAIDGVAFVLVVFGIVVLHELGHALTARHYGVRTQDITLLPIGGVARLERIPEEPRAELLIALAGPAVNVALAIVFGALSWSIGQSPFATDPTAAELGWLPRLFWLNCALATFNMLPAFPMDGGRALRALLAWRMDRLRATLIAAGVGRTMAIAFGLIGLMWNPLLAVIALFVWFGAGAELQATEITSTIRGLRVEDAMIRHFEVLEPDGTLAMASAHVLGGFQTDFPVVGGGRVVGVLTHGDLILGLAQHGASARVDAVMQRDFCTADASEPLTEVFTRMQAKTCRTVPVLSGGRPVGMLTLAALGELVAIRSAMSLSAERESRGRAFVAQQA